MRWNANRRRQRCGIFCARGCLSVTLPCERIIRTGISRAGSSEGFSWSTRFLAVLVSAFAWLPTPSAFAQASFTVSPNIVDVTRMKSNETDPSVAISPLNPSNIVVATAFDGAVPGLFFAFSTNRGGTWMTNMIATNGDSQGLNPAYGEPSVAWDSFGNLFLAYLPSSFEGVEVAVSTNGGSNFVSLTNLAAFDVTDTPRLSAPPSGAAAGTVWVVYKDYTLANTPLQVQGLLSKGLGAIGTFGLPQIVPESSAGGFPDIAAGPLGELMVAFQDNLQGLPVAGSPYPSAFIWVALETNAIPGGAISNHGFDTSRSLVGDAISGLTYIAAAPTGIGVNAAPGLAFDYDLNDTNYDHVYLIYTAIGPNGNLVINLLTAINRGTDWIAQTYVDDDATTGFNDHFLPRVAVDPSTGIIGCAWYDCRNDQGANSQAITNVVESSFTYSSLTVTNVGFTDDVPSISETWTNSPSDTNDIIITIVADSVSGTSMTNKGDNIYIYGPSQTNFVITLSGTNTGNATVTVILTNIFTLAYTSGEASNQEAVMYTTLSFDGANSFLTNEPLISTNQVINAPAVGFASDVAGSGSLTGWGHYTGLAAFGANFFPAWADNSDVVGHNPDGANSNFDLYMLSTSSNKTSISVATADLSVWVTNSPNPVVSEGVLLYSVIVTNNGPAAAKPVVVTNILSTNVTLVSATPALGGTAATEFTTNGQEEIVFTWPSLAAKGALTSTIRVTASASSIVTNSASVFSPFYDLVPTNNTNTLVLVIDGEDLATGMTTSETNILIGDTVASWVTVTNLGPSTNGPVFITNYFSPNWTNIVVQAQGTNLVTNNGSGPIAILNLGLLPVGQPVTAAFLAVATSGGPSAWESNYVTSQDVDTNQANNSAGTRFFVNGEHLTLGMTESSGNIFLGQAITYTIDVTNFGLSFSGQVAVSDSFSTNLTPISATQSQGSNAIANNTVVFDLGFLPAGQTASMTVTAAAVSGPPTGTSVASVFSTDFDTNLAGHTATAKVTIIPTVPMITNLVVTPLASSAFISWDTRAPATAQVEYGLSGDYGGFSATSSTAGTKHVILLTGLTGGVSYDFVVLSWVGLTLYTTNGSFSTTNTLILNTEDAKYTGVWTAASVAAGIYGSYYQYATTTVQNASAWALFDPTIPASGLYNVYIWHPQNDTFTTNAQVHVTGATNAIALSVNQTVDGGAWQALATNMYFAAGTNGNVTLFNNTGATNKFLVANAMMWVYNAAQDYSSNGTVPAWWANFYFGTNADGSVNGSEDSDGDGYSNYAEYVLGTDPTDATSHLNFVVSPLSSNEIAVTFSPCQGGRSYQLQAAPDLAIPIWTPLTNVFTVNTNGSGTFTVAQPSGAPAFYRLSAQILP